MKERPVTSKQGTNQKKIPDFEAIDCHFLHYVLVILSMQDALKDAKFLGRARRSGDGLTESYTCRRRGTPPHHHHPPHG